MVASSFSQSPIILPKSSRRMLSKTTRNRSSYPSRSSARWITSGELQETRLPTASNLQRNGNVMEFLYHFVVLNWSSLYSCTIVSIVSDPQLCTSSNWKWHVTVPLCSSYMFYLQAKVQKSSPPTHFIWPKNWKFQAANLGWTRRKIVR